MSLHRNGITKKSLHHLRSFFTGSIKVEATNVFVKTQRTTAALKQYPLIAHRVGNNVKNLSSRYERSWEGEEKEARRKKRKLQKQRLGVSLCTDSYSSYCDTRAFFLTPVRSKSREKAANKVDFRSICKIL